MSGGQIHRLETEVALQREELRLVAARMKRIDPHRRPQYLPAERMATLELRAICGWSCAFDGHSITIWGIFYNLSDLFRHLGP